ncbi:hypothetical protein [Spiroplasma endosymbiont of Nebria brevicollis]|uniref:hypothetical protein n=1 Tax=Spiroplasma endosymbiont of Nebria brevicollis TaxID=3066284 RepID=UPI00313BC956
MENDYLGKHLVFHFQFLEKVKLVNNEILNELKQISRFTINQLRLSSKQQGGFGFGVIDTKGINIINTVNDDFIKYIMLNHSIEITNPIKKYDYIRVGRKERIYGKLYEGIFYTLVYDKDKKKQ